MKAKAKTESIPIMEKQDEVLLLDRKFSYGMSGTTLWGKDVDDQEWCVILDSPGEALLWCPVRSNGGLNPAVTMTRELFGRMF